ncbi:MAG: hypothetical protein HPKKFMNG_02925 [Planctomycetes bacterium]|nr:hypothetical protein [Planctomycetota bacterium]
MFTRGNYRLFFSTLALILALGACAGQAKARDLSDYGYYLGVRLKMYDEAERLLRRQMDRGSDDEKARARSALARVFKAKADDDFSRSGDLDARSKGYESAEEVYGNPEDQDGRIELAILRIELARAKARLNAEGARALADKALGTLKEERAALETKRNELGTAFWDNNKLAHNYRQAFLNICIALYVKGLTYSEGSSERAGFFRQASNEVSELQFSFDISVEWIDAVLLLGDIELALRNPEGAVAKYLEIPSLLADYPAGPDVGSQALRGWLRAAELQTGDLGYEKRFLQQCIDQYQKAFTQYGAIRELATDFKRFNLFRISAQIRLGANVNQALDELFKLAADNDLIFKRQALSVLADIGAGDGVSPELRLRCGKAVIKDAVIVGYGPILKVLRAYQLLLAECTSVQTFEMYAPECFSKIASIYSDLLHRYVDGAMAYREACLRTWYFIYKFGKDNGDTAPEAGQPVPDHMKNMCDLITDTKSAYDFPGEMAKAYSKVAGWLVSSKFGEPGNKTFEGLKTEADDYKAKLGGEDAINDLAFANAGKLYNAKKFSQAAVRYASLPVRYKKFRIAMYFAATAYANQIEDPAARHPSRSGEANEQETSEFFAEQKARHARDFEGLPKQIWEKQEEAHFAAMADTSLKVDVAMWHKAIYYFKKYMLVVVLRNWDDIKERVNPDKDNLVQCFLAVAEIMQERWKQQPERSRQPSDEMEMMGRAAYWYAFLMRNPAKSDVKRDELRNANRATALTILKRHWDLFGSHFASAAEVQRAVIELSFWGLAEEQDGDGAEALLRAYEAAFPDQKKKIADMIARIYTIFIDTLNPRTQALTNASTNLRSLFNQLKIGLFKAEGSFGSNKEKLDKYNAAKTTLEKHRLLAQHFWDEWLVKVALGTDKNVTTLVTPELLPILEKRWNEYAESYPKRWGDAVRAEFDALIKDKAYDSIRSDAQKLTTGSNTELLDRLDAQARDTKLPADKAGLYATLNTQVSLNTAHLAYFVGTTFIYDFGGFLEETSASLDERMRPMLTKVLTYYERWRETRGTGNTDLPAADLLILGKNYFRVRDWKRAIQYLQQCLDLHQKSKYFGNELLIPTNRQAKPPVCGGTKSGEELELKYQLGRAYFEQYRESRNVEDLKKAAVLMRRAYCFVIVRNVNEMAKSQRGGVLFDLTFKSQIELYYLDTIDTLIAIFLELHALKGPAVEYPPFVDQFNVWLEADPKKVQALPKTEADYLWRARRIHLDQWTSFAQLDDHPYRPEYRKSLLAWGQLTTDWLRKYGKQAMGIEEIASEAQVKREVDDTLTLLRNKALPNIGFEDAETKKFKGELTKAADALEAEAKKLKMR